MNNAIGKLTRILQRVSFEGSPSAQVKIIVDSVSETIGSDVCSLYTAEGGGDMVLMASHGFAGARPVRIPVGRGLVGLVAKQKHPLSIADAFVHPDFFYVDDSNESSFHGFCGVPLVQGGHVIGVLVVQSKSSEKFSDETEAVLVTLASQLAMIVDRLPRSLRSEPVENTHLYGLKGAPGIGVGVVYLCVNDELSSVPDAVCEDIDRAVSHWHQLLVEVVADIELEKVSVQKGLSGVVTGIFDVYEMMVSDKSLSERVEAELRAGNWLPGALRNSISYFSDIFEAMDDPYLRARSEDISYLGNKIYRAWLGSSSMNSERGISHQDPVILVGRNISVSDIASVPSGQLVGIVCQEGSSLSHTAVLANALGIPAVMGLKDHGGFTTGAKLIVDGNQSLVVAHPAKSLSVQYRQLREVETAHRVELEALKTLPAETTDGIRIKLFANTGLQADIAPGINNGAEGIGLYRTEIPFMVRDSFPNEEEQIAVYRKVFEAYGDKPIYMRTLDIGGDKQLQYFPINGEQNPALGWRGIRFTLDNIALLMTQVRVMIRAAQGGNNLYIMLPMISSTQELDAFIELLDEACSQLSQEGISSPRPRLGVMIEVPAAISRLRFWRGKIDFVSIGTNDLSQYLLALDRNNARVANRFDHVHPSVLHEIHRIVDLAQKHGLPVSLCGEMASDPVAIVLLVGMGVRQLSMSAAMLPRVKGLIRTINTPWAASVLKAAEMLDNPGEIKSLVQTELAKFEGFSF
jgi:phosphoenolpyruvate-protein phosphotransferase